MSDVSVSKELLEDWLSSFESNSLPKDFEPIKLAAVLKEYLASKDKVFVPKGIWGEEEDYEPRIIDTDNAMELYQNFAFPNVRYRFKPTSKVNLFVDMDGTIAHWRRPKEKYWDINGDVKYFHQDDIYDKGYFAMLPPEKEVVEAVKKIISEDNGIEVYILSAVEKNSPTALADKKQWLDRNFKDIPIPEENRIFMPCGTRKADYLNLELTDCNILLDDYTRNLQEFTTGRVNNLGIKLVNGINDTHGSWKGDRVYGDMDPITLKSEIEAVFSRHLRRS